MRSVSCRTLLCLFAGLSLSLTSSGVLAQGEQGDSLTVRSSLDAGCSAARLGLAQDAYERGRVEETRTLLIGCLNAKPNKRDPEKGTLVGAYRLLAHAFLAVDSTAYAKKSIERLLEEDPYYDVDPLNDTEAFQRLFDQLNPRWLSKKFPFVAPGGKLERKLVRWALYLGSGFGLCVATRICFPPDDDLPSHPGNPN